MDIQTVKTEKIRPFELTLIELLEHYLPVIRERDIVVITSKIVSLAENNVKEIGSIEKHELIKSEADYYLYTDEMNDSSVLTIKNNLFIPSAGIDESNGDGYYVLWPKNSQRTAETVCGWLREKYSLRKVGVIITDSKTTPLRWGTTGIALGYAGFRGLRDYIGKKDNFGRELKHTIANTVDPLAAIAVLAMGEGAEQTPLAILRNVELIDFDYDAPRAEELSRMHVGLSDPMYKPLFAGLGWQNKKDR